MARSTADCTAPNRWASPAFATVPTTMRHSERHGAALVNDPSSGIVAAVVEDELTADRLCTSLRRNGAGRDEMDRSALNPAGQHHGLPLGGDGDTDAGAIVGAGMGGGTREPHG